jgi:hypothetical protein
MGYMFSYCNSLTSLDLSSWNFIKCSTISGIFNDCKSLNSLKFGINFKVNTSTISMFNNNTYQDIELDMGGNTDFSTSSSSTLNLATIWRGTDETKVQKFVNFANSLGTKSSTKTRTIKIYTNLYNTLTTEQKALITDKGYSLSYGTS